MEPRKLIELMNPSSLSGRGWVLTLLALGCFALCTQAQAQDTPDPASTCSFCTADGTNALANATGAANSAFGWWALFTNTDASFNTAVGAGALLFNNGTPNTAVGAAALLFNTTGGNNVAVGAGALVNNNDGSDNNAIGAFALNANVSGFFNNAHGREALTSNTGDQNNAFGDLALLNNTSGSFNTAMGDDALDGCIDGNSNVALGDEAGTAIVHSSNNIAIGAGVTGGGGPFEDLSNTCFIGSIFNEPVSDPGTQTAVFVDQFNVLGFAVSTRRAKHDIQPMDKASEALFALKPVTYKYNNDKKGRTQFGLIAEDVAAVNPDLVLLDETGQAMTIRYEQINAMLLNEFIKEHKKVEQQQASISQLKSEMQTMVAQLKEQAAQIQKVSAQLEMQKPAPKVANNR